MNEEKTRVTMIAEYLKARYGQVLFFTVYFDSHTPQDQRTTTEYGKRLSRFLKSLRRKATAESETLEMTTCLGFGDWYGVHNHIVCNWLPELRPCEEVDQLRSEWISKQLRRFGLDGEIQLARSSIAVGRYTAANLNSTIENEIPRKMQRLNISKGLMRIVHRKEEPQAVSNWCDDNRGRYYAMMTDGEPIQIPRSLVTAAVLYNFELWCEDGAGSRSHYDDFRIVGYGENPQFPLQTASCISIYSQTLSPNDFHTLTDKQLYDRFRDATLKRKLWRKCSDANRTAEEYEIKLGLPIGSLGRVALFDMLRVWRRQYGSDFWTGEELQLPTLSLDHVKPFSDGGKNEIDNMCFTNKRTNASKGNQDPETFAIKLAEIGIDHHLRPDWIPVQLRLAL